MSLKRLQSTRSFQSLHGTFCGVHVNRTSTTKVNLKIWSCEFFYTNQVHVSIVSVYWKFRCIGMNFTFGPPSCHRYIGILSCTFYYNFCRYIEYSSLYREHLHHRKRTPYASLLNRSVTVYAYTRSLDAGRAPARCTSVSPWKPIPNNKRG